MIDDPLGSIDYEDRGRGPTLLFVPGSFSTGAAWRAVVQPLADRYRIVTTSLLGYGGTLERRKLDSAAIESEVEALDAVVRRAGAEVHIVGHSFGAHVALAYAMRCAAPPLSLTLMEPPAPTVLKLAGEHELFGRFRAMTDAYFEAWQAGEAMAARRVIDFYGGDGTFDAMPLRLRDFVVQTTAANVLDWLSAYRDVAAPQDFARIGAPSLVIRGAHGHPAVQRGNELISHWLSNARLHTLPGASHFMIATHATEVARLVDEHVSAVEAERLCP